MKLADRRIIGDHRSVKLHFPTQKICQKPPASTCRHPIIAGIRIHHASDFRFRNRRLKWFRIHFPDFPRIRCRFCRMDPSHSAHKSKKMFCTRKNSVLDIPVILQPLYISRSHRRRQSSVFTKRLPLPPKPGISAKIQYRRQSLMDSGCAGLFSDCFSHPLFQFRIPCGSLCQLDREISCFRKQRSGCRLHMENCRDMMRACLHDPFLQFPDHSFPLVQCFQHARKQTGNLPHPIRIRSVFQKPLRKSTLCLRKFFVQTHFR